MNFRCSVLAFAYLENRLSNLLGNTSSHNFDKKKFGKIVGMGVTMPNTFHFCDGIQILENWFLIKISGIKIFSHRGMRWIEGIEGIEGSLSDERVIGT